MTKVKCLLLKIKINMIGITIPVQKILIRNIQSVKNRYLEDK